jgi:cytochrome P450
MTSGHEDRPAQSSEANRGIGVRSPRLDVNFGDPAVIADPYVVLEEIRAAGRAVWNEPAQGWMITGYDDCHEVLSDPKGTRFGVVGARHPEVTFWFLAPNMIIADGAEHRRLRQGVSSHFTPAAVKRRWEPRVREVVEAQLAPLVAGDDSIDLIDDFAKIPVIVVAELLGVPADRHDDFRKWSNAIISNLAFGNERPDARRVMDETIAELNEYLTEEIERHRRDQPDDILTVMINMPNWTEDEMRSSAANLLLAGYDTTAKLMGDCLVALEQHPDQRRLLVEHPELIENAVEEVLRWHGATQGIIRLAVEDTTLGSVDLPAGDMLYLLLGAANRDPSRWPDPYRFDVRRDFKKNLGRSQLGFGGGPHICIGAHLARVEVRIALETLLRLAPEYRLRDIDYGNSFFAHGPEQGTIDVRQPSTVA